MPAPTERPEDRQDQGPLQPPGSASLPEPVEPQTTVQQLRDAGFSEAQQTVLTTAFLRVLALWTQQATRDDVHGEHQALEQRVAQQCETLREAIRQDLVQHGTTLREEFHGALTQQTATWHEALQSAFTRQADVLHSRDAQPPRGRVVSWWVSPVLLGVTCAGVLLLVVLTILGR